MDSHDDPPDLRARIAQATETLQALTAAHQKLWEIGDSDWSVDQAAGTIEFDSPAGFRIVAPVQIVGTYDTLSGTWLWGWDHPSIVAPLTDHARRVLAFGREHGFDVLTTRKLECPESRGWDFTALACHLCGAQGAYRGPTGDVRVFMTFGKLSFTKISSA